MIKALVIFCAAALGISLAGARAEAEIDVSASVNTRTAAVGQEILLSVTVSGGFQSLPAPKLPDMPDFNVYPSGTSTNFSLVNGRVTSSKVSRFVLVPKSEGKCVIPAVSVEHEGREYLTEEIEITVTASTSARPPAAGPSDAASDDLSLEASLDKERVYVGEQVTLTFRFYRRTALLDSRFVPPSTTGFWVEELPGEKSYYAVKDGIQYYVTEIAMALFPTTDGVMEIGPAGWECVLRERVGPFQMLRGLTSAGRKASAESERLDVKVLPLPSRGRPQGFSGAVGRFSVTADVDLHEVMVEEPVTLTVTLSGAGNVGAVGEIDLPELGGFRSYDSGGATDLEKDDGLVKGTKSFSKVYIPGVPGEYVIPAVEFPYFDPGGERYVIASSEEIRIVVRAGEEGAEVKWPAAGRGGDFVKDIRYIKTEMPDFSPAGDRLYKSLGFILAQLLAPVMLFGAYAYRAAGERARKDPARARARRAGREALKALSRAISPAESESTAQAWKSVSGALRGYMADIATVSASGLRIDDVPRVLRSLGIPEELAREAAAALEECDRAAFAPGGAPKGSLRDAVSRVSDLIDRIEKARVRSR